MPLSVANRIEKLQLDFHWGGMGADLKCNLVRWENVCTPRQIGGLVLGRLKVFNQALLAKWLWKYVKEGDLLWKHVADSKYGPGRGGWCLAAMREFYGVIL